MGRTSQRRGCKFRSLLSSSLELFLLSLVTNYYTGQQCYLPHKIAAKVLVVLGEMK